MISAYLMSTTVARGDFKENPFKLQIHFYKDHRQSYEFFTDKLTGSEKRLKVQQYLETILDKKVDLQFTLLDEEGAGQDEEHGFSNITSPRELYMKDFEKEPALKLLAELFLTEHITTMKRSPS